MACTSDFTPTFQAQNPAISGDRNGWLNCAAYVGAMGASYATCQAKRTTGATVRSLTNEPTPDPSSPGLSVIQVQEALGDLGVPVTTFLKATWADVQKWVDGGRFVSLAVQYSVIRLTRFSGDRAFYGGHAIGVPPGWEAMDPLCDGRRDGIYRYQKETYPRELLKKAAGAFRLRRHDGSISPIGYGYAQGWYTVAHPHPGGAPVPRPEESDVKVTATVYQRWTANGTNGVLRASPIRAGAITDRLPAGTTVVSRAEAETPDGNYWRLTDWPVGSRNARWFLRKGPGIPPDHDFIAGPIVEDPVP